MRTTRLESLCSRDPTGSGTCDLLIVSSTSYPLYHPVTELRGQQMFQRPQHLLIILEGYYPRRSGILEEIELVYISLGEIYILSRNLCENCWH